VTGAAKLDMSSSHEGLQPGIHAAESASTKVLLTSLSGQIGGMELRIADEARQLTSLGLSPELAISSFPGSASWLASLKQESMIVRELDFPPFFEEWRFHRWNYLRARGRPAWKLRSLGYSLAHVFYAWTETGGSRLWLCHYCRIPTVISVHNTFPYHEFSPWHARRTLEAFRSVKGIYGVSKSALESFESIYGRYFPAQLETRVIHNFVDTERFASSTDERMRARVALGLPLDAPVIGSVGRLDSQKVPLTVLEVFQRVKRLMPASVLVYCGQGPLAEQVKHRVEEMGLTASVKFLGFRHDVERVFPALDVHVLLSRNEGFGISTVEAFSCGVPVVVTDVPGSRDIVSGTGAGYLVPFGDSGAAAKAIVSILQDNDLRNSMAMSARQAATTKFTKRAWARDVSDFYGCILDGMSRDGL
jgi:L-malate glycosyltransferase